MVFIKDDVSPQTDYFNFIKMGVVLVGLRLQSIVLWIVQLCIHLLLLQDLIPNNIGMANVSCVPLSYIFLRGQGIKIFSLIVKRRNLENTRIPTLKDLVIQMGMMTDLKEQLFLNQIQVFIWMILYQYLIMLHCIRVLLLKKIFHNMTHIYVQKKKLKNPEKYQWIRKYTTLYNFIRRLYLSKKKKTVHKIKAETQTTCYFAKPKDGKTGIVPTILKSLLDERKQTRALAKKTDDENKKKVLDGLQLAYKVTANSVYGQMGAKTSPMFFKRLLLVQHQLEGKGLMMPQVV